MEPIKVFISSSQAEFGKFRKNLKTVIDSELRNYQRIFNAILVESKRGINVYADIEKGISEASIYIGIFGRDYSQITVDEFKKARSNILPLLIYRFRKNRRIKSITSGGSKVDKFLEDEVMRYGIRIRGPYHSEDDLESAIMTDLVFQMVEMVKESANVRRTIGR